MASITFYLQRNIGGVINVYSGVFARLNNNITFLNYISAVASDANGMVTVTGVPAGEYTVFVGTTGTVPGTPSTIGDSHFLVPVIQTPGGVEGVVAIASIADYLIASINSVTALTYTMPSNRAWLINVYVRVATSQTNLTLTLTYNDASGAQVVTYFTNRALNVGSYFLPQLYFKATTSNPIVLSATASAANQVYLTASFIGVD